MTLDTSLTAGQAGHISDHQSLHEHFNARAGSHRVYDVTDPDYGAEGNGTTDDRAAIQAAIAAADTAGGGVVFLPPGTFLVDSTHGADKWLLEMESNLSILGAGVGVTTIKVGDSLPKDRPLLYGSNVTDVEIAHLTLDGNKSRISPSSDIGTEEDEGIDFKGASTARVWMHDLYIHDMGGDAIDFDHQPDNIAISNVVFEDNGGCAVHGGVIDLTITNCQSISNGQERFTNAAGVVSDHAAAYSFTSAGENIVLAGCTSNGDTRGVVIHGSQIRMAVLGVVISAADNEGIWINGVGSTYIAIEGCAVRTGTRGLQFDDGDFISVVGCSFNGQATGIEVDGGGELVATGNVIQPTASGAGIHVVSVTAASNRHLGDNLVTGGGYGIRIEAGSSHIVGNEIDTVTAQGIDLRTSSTTDCTVTGNRVRNSSGNGIRLLSSPTNCIITGNDVPDGISISGTGHTIRDNVGYGPATETASAITLSGIHRIVNVDTSGGAVAVTLPDNAAFDGKDFVVRRDGGSDVTLPRAGLDTWDDTNTLQTLADDGAFIWFCSIGDTEWKIINTGGTVTGS